MNFVQDYGIVSPSSCMAPEISLRDPLDQEFVLNRKMAKKYYEKSLQDKMLNNKVTQGAEREKRKKELGDKEAKKQTEIEKLRKGEAALLKSKVRDRIAVEDERRQTRNRQARMTAIKILEDSNAERDELKERLKKKQDEYDKKLNDQFERDKSNRDQIAAKQDSKAQKEAANERSIATKLVDVEMTGTQKIASKEAQLKKRQDTALAQSEQKNRIYAQQQEKNKKAEEDNLIKYVMKTQKVEKCRKQTVKMMRLVSNNPDKVDHKERLQEINKMKEEQSREQKRKINKG